MKWRRLTARAALGLDSSIGSLTPGKRADIIMVKTGGLTMGVFHGPHAHAVGSGRGIRRGYRNGRTGRILKRGGKLTAMPVDEVIAGAKQSLVEVGKRL